MFKNDNDSKEMLPSETIKLTEIEMLPSGTIKITQIAQDEPNAKPDTITLAPDEAKALINSLRTLLKQLPK